MSYWRINLIFCSIILFLAAIIGRLIFVQILNHQYWLALAYGQQKSFVSLYGERGEIFFQDRTNLAINQNVDLVYASPNKIKDPEGTAETLSSVLNLDKSLILEKLEKENSYELIKKKLNQDEISKLKEVDLEGIYLSKEPGRYYPLENLASKVIGFWGGDQKGQYGIEGYYENILQGKERFLEKEKGPRGYLVNNFQGQSENGADLILTLDYNIQFQAEKLLEKAKENLDFEEAEIIVIEPGSGKILALANYPNFNPNQYSEVKNLEVFQNSSISKIFEPGSVFKPITMAAALDQEKITPQTTYVDQGSIKIGGYTIYNYNKRTWGERTMIEVLERSINTGAVFAERQMGHNIFSEYVESFGIFEPTGIDLQGETSSSNKEFNSGREVNSATAAFGQGIEMNSLQLVRAFSAIASGGKLMKPYLVDKIIDGDKTIETQPEIQNPSVISQKTASQLTMMLINVIENGFGKAAKISGYYIAGKTGTAEIPWSALGINKKGYSEKTIQSFIAYAPALDPKFLILVKLNNPKARTAEYSAAPMFRELAKYIIDYWQIPPDYEPSQVAAEQKY